MSADLVVRRSVYICHPFSGDPWGNRRKVLLICRAFVERGILPVAPQVYLPQFIDEDTQRDLAMEMCRRMLALCDALAICGDTVTAGMRDEIAHAARLGIPVGTLSGGAPGNVGGFDPWPLEEKP